MSIFKNEDSKLAFTLYVFVDKGFIMSLSRPTYVAYSLEEMSDDVQRLVCQDGEKCTRNSDYVIYQTYHLLTLGISLSMGCSKPRALIG